MPSGLYGAGTWTLPLEHEKILRSTQRKMLRLIVQTKRKYNSNNKKDSEEKDGTDDERSNNGLSIESEDEASTSIGRDQNSSVSLEKDTDDSTSQADDEEKDWIDFIK